MNVRVVLVLFAATWLVHRPVSVYMHDSDLDYEPENYSTCTHECDELFDSSFLQGQSSTAIS